MFYSKHNRIIIEPGTTYENRSLKYLAPAIPSVGFPDTVIKNISNLQILGVGIADAKYRNAEDYPEDTLYVLIDVNGRMKYGKYININASRKLFETTLAQIKKNSAGYLADYSYDNVRLGHQHMIVFNLNIKGIVNRFIAGEYSKMYTPEQIEKYIIKTKKINNTEYLNDIYRILAKDPTYNKHFQQRVSQEFSTATIIESPREFDFPPILGEEIFNYV